MKKLIIYEFELRLIPFACLVATALILYFALSLDSLEQHSHFSGNIDYIFPIMLLPIIYLNFKYLKNKDECISASNVPKTKYEVFKIKYYVSLIQIGIIMLVFIIFSILFEYSLNFLSYPGNYYDFNNVWFLVLSLFLKFIFTILLFNLLLYLFLKGKKTIDGFSHIIIFTVIASSIYGVVNYILLYSGNIDVLNVIIPFNTLKLLTLSFQTLIFSSLFEINNIPITVLLIIISIISLSSFLLVFTKMKRFKLEDLDKKANSIPFKIILIAFSCISILCISILFDNFTQALSSILIFNFVLYLMYSGHVGRFIPTPKERTFYFILFIAGTFLPYLI